MSGFAVPRKSFTAGLVTAVAGLGPAQSTGAHAAARYQDGVIGWAVGNPSRQVVNPDGGGQRTVTPSGGGFDAKTDRVWKIACSPPSPGPKRPDG